MKIINGNKSVDHRGIIFHNNDFDLTKIKRSYIIENHELDYRRGWKGHLKEKRWFVCIKGEIQVSIISIDNLINKINSVDHVILTEDKFDCLFVDHGYATLIKQQKEGSRLMAFSDYIIGTSNDEELRWANDYIKI